MGTDIHPLVEIKKDGEWYVPEEQYRIEHDTWGDEEYVYMTTFGEKEIVRSYRNYSSFAILADVRNGIGFAGVDTGDRVEPFDYPRGMPNDVSDMGRRWFEQADHTPSYFSLEELKKGFSENYFKTINKRGWVDYKTFSRFMWDNEMTEYDINNMSDNDIEKMYNTRAIRSPETWSGGVSGSRIIHLSFRDMLQWYKKYGLIHDYKDIEDEDDRETLINVYVNIQWTKLIGDTIPLVKDWIQELSSYAKEHDLEDDEIRVLFYFDS